MDKEPIQIKYREGNGVIIAGNYYNHCFDCRKQFISFKGDMICPICEKRKLEDKVKELRQGLAKIMDVVMLLGL